MSQITGIPCLFAGDFVPRGYKLCNGQLLQVSKYPEYANVVGTKFGGDGINTVGTPTTPASFSLLFPKFKHIIAVEGLIPIPEAA